MVGTGAASAGTAAGASAMTAGVGARRFWERKEWRGDGGALMGGSGKDKGGHGLDKETGMDVRARSRARHPHGVAAARQTVALDGRWPTVQQCMPHLHAPAILSGSFACPARLHRPAGSRNAAHLLDRPWPFRSDV